MGHKQVSNLCTVHWQRPYNEALIKTVAIQKVARAKGFKYVLDSTTGTGLILADGYDLMADVKKDLGI